jgi:8-oxo-dGTP pyrophosphatase MutT (NUDIX family)
VGDVTFTCDDVRVACATLPPPETHVYVHSVAPRRAAALLIPIVDDGDEAAVIVTKRAKALSNAGDWVFPGGGVDDDESHGDAARREAAEELGIDPALITVVGQLDTRGPIVSGYVIEVYVGLVAGHPELRPHAGEVADVATVRLSELLHPDSSFRSGLPEHFTSSPLLDQALVARPMGSLRFYTVRPGEHLWGLQADLVFELLHHLTGGAHDF